MQSFRFELESTQWFYKTLLPKYNRSQLNFPIWILKVFLATAVTLIFLIWNSCISQRWRGALNSHFAAWTLWWCVSSFALMLFQARSWRRTKRLMSLWTCSCWEWKLFCVGELLSCLSEPLSSPPSLLSPLLHSPFSLPTYWLRNEE